MSFLPHSNSLILDLSHVLKNINRVPSPDSMIVLIGENVKVQSVKIQFSGS